jgi:hypothetical protein
VWFSLIYSTIIIRWKYLIWRFYSSVTWCCVPRLWHFETMQCHYPEVFKRIRRFLATSLRKPQNSLLESKFIQWMLCTGHSPVSEVHIGTQRNMPQCWQSEKLCTTSHTHMPVPGSDTTPYLLPVAEEEKYINFICLLACLVRLYLQWQL